MITLRGLEIIFGGEKGRKMNPLSLIFTLCLRHSAACCMIIPMNIFYPDNVYYHEGFCIVQLGAFIVLFCQQYGYTLNVKTQECLTQMKICVSISFIVIMWTRVIRYAWLWSTLATMIWEDKNWVVIYCGVFPTLLLTLFNLVVMKDGAERFIKFVAMDVKEPSVRQISETGGNMKNLTVKSDIVRSNSIRSRMLYKGKSAEDIWVEY